MSNKEIILITGGTRSGKSTFAERMALEKCAAPVYLATATVRDEEFRDRVARHQARRGPEWTTVEEPLHLSHYDFSGRVVLVDCVTLWSTNAFFDAHESVDGALVFLKREFLQLVSQSATFIFVTNEIGLGGIADNELMRKFTDLQGWMNQFVAEHADEVYMMVSGIPLKVK